MTQALRRPAAIGVLVALLLVGAWWKLLWQPQGSALAAAHRQTSAASTNLYTVEQNIGHLKHLQLISPKLTALEQQLSAAAPASDEIDQFLLTLEGLRQQAGVDFGSISLSQPASSTGGLSTIGVRFSVQGEYFAVQGFLDALRAASRIFVIDSLSEAPGQQTGKTSTQSVSLSLSAHLLSGLTPPSAAVEKLITAPPTTAAPTGIISGPVTKARNAANGANASTAGLNSRANAIGGP